MFKEKSRHNMGVYVKDLLIKNKEPEKHTSDLREAFTILWKYKMRLNPSKYTLGVK